MTEIERISCIIGTAGHIDHGKTSLVKALTGIDTDRLKEEKKRGVSIDLGFAYMDFEEGGKTVRAALVDVPGHERFIKNMLAGTTGIDFVLFVVAADDGVMPQTREHLDIIHLLGIKKGIFVITKTDLVGAGRVSEVREEIRALIEPTALKGSPTAAVSTLTGKGIGELKRLIRETGLLARNISGEGFFRLPVDRSFSVKGFGAVVTGTVVCGSIGKGEEAVCFPGGNRVKVRGIQSLFLNAENVSAGQRAALNLANVSHNDLKRGDLLASLELTPFADAARTRRLHHVECSFEFLPSSDRQRVIRNRASLKVHHLTGESLCTLLLKDKKDARPGVMAYGRLVLKKPLLMLRGDRFILRDPSINMTIGGGEVCLPYLSLELLNKKGGGVPPGLETGEVLLKLLPENGLGFSSFSLCLMLNLSPARLGEAVTGSNGEFASAGEFILNAKRLVGVKGRMLELLKAFHASNPMEQGVMDEFFLKSMKEFSAGVPRDKGPLLLKEVLDMLISDGSLKREGALYSLFAHRPASKGPESKIEAAIMELFSKGLQPDIEGLGKLPFKKGEADKVMAYLLRGGAIVRLKEGSFISGASLKGARDKMEAFIKENGSIRASDFRDLLGCGRKFAIEILEYFDKERLTIRHGDLRKLR